jgi:16S rRNA (cytidine1402-2'-O)-methyltransferase
MNKQKGRLYLLSAPLAPYSPDFPGKGRLEKELPAGSLKLMESLDHFIVESERSAARILSRVKNTEAMSRLEMRVLDEHTNPEELESLISPMIDGADCGLLTEAGLPCVADPGAALVAKAHDARIHVVPLSGPSSILLSLIASGCDAQKFSFLGYLPVSKEDRRKALKKISAEFLVDGITRIWIETPYRNDALLGDCLDFLPASARFCVASSISSEDETIRSATIAEWKKSSGFAIGKRPSVFVIGHSGGISPRNTCFKRPGEI